MTEVIFSGVARQSDGLNTLIRNEFGIEGRRVGSDLVFTNSDLERGFGQRRLVRLHHQMALDEPDETATALNGLISDELQSYQPTPPAEPIRMRSVYGLISKVAIATTELAVQPQQEVVGQLARSIIPLLRDELNAKYVTGVTVDARAVQACFSLSKFGLLVGIYDLPQVSRLVFERGSFSALLPSAFDALSYIDALTRYSPIALTLPVRRLNCAWHFQSDAMWSFPSEAVNGLMWEFMTALNPLSNETHIFGLRGLSGMGESNIWRWLRLVVEGVNRLLCYLTDFRHFVDPSGNVAFLRQVQAISSIQLIFADVAAINFSTSAHQRISFAFAALDKLSNLRVQLGNVPVSETTAVKALCSKSQQRELVRLFHVSCNPLGYEELRDILVHSAERCFDDLHEHLGQEASDSTANSEAERLDRLWSQRNVRHGAFLQRNQFEKLFLESRGAVPETLGGIVFLLMLGLLSDPKAFLNFRPEIEARAA